MKKKLLLFLISLISIVNIFSFPAYGMEYKNNFPDYLNFTGGCYCEVESTSGTVALVFPIEYKSNTFGFDGHSGFNICNCTNSTVYGRAVLANGKEYYLRFQSFGTAEIRTDNGYNQYEYLTINNILNTDIDFMDNSSSDRQSDEVFDGYKFSFDEMFYISLAVFGLFIIVAAIIWGCSRI